MLLVRTTRPLVHATASATRASPGHRRNAKALTGINTIAGSGENESLPKFRVGNTN